MCADNTVKEDDTMAKGSGVVKVQDEDDLEIEALIQRELDALGDEDLVDDGEVLNQQDALGHEKDGNAEVQARKSNRKGKEKFIFVIRRSFEKLRKRK